MKMRSRIHDGLYEADNTFITSNVNLVSELIKYIEPLDCFYDDKQNCLFYVFDFVEADNVFSI